MLSEKIKKFIEQVNLVDNYRKLSEKYGDSNREPMEEIDIKKVQEIILDLGYESRYYKSEKFFKVILFKDNEVELGYNIGLKYGLVELIIFLFKDKKCIEGEPICSIIQQYTGEDELIKDPRFCDYDELKEILKYMFDILLKYMEVE